MRTEQGFVTGSLELDAAYTDGFLRSINRTYGTDTSLKLYVDLRNYTATVYDTPGGGHQFGDGSQVGPGGFQGWGSNKAEIGRSLEFLLPEDVTSEHPDFTLTYTSYGRFYVDTTGRGGNEHEIDTFFYFGIPTAAGDVPRTGNALYTGIAVGKLYDFTDTYELRGTATLTAYFDTGQIQTELLLTGYGSEAPVDFGVFDGLATLATDSNEFRGTWVASSSGFEGSILGAFFGPAATEFGYSFGINRPDLSAIGGGVVVGGQDPSLPPPPPPPTPTPPTPPPAPPSGSSFPLASARTFDAFTSDTSYTGSTISGRTDIGPAETHGLSAGLEITITPDFENGTYTVSGPGLAVAFALNDTVPAPNPDSRYVSLTDGAENNLMLFNNFTPGNGTNAPDMQFHYLSYGMMFENDAATSEHRATAMVFGDMTSASDRPVTGTARYELVASAYAQVTYYGMLEGQGSLTVDFASGDIDTSMKLYSNYLGGFLPFANYSGTGTLASGASTFAGTIQNDSGTLTGDFAGGFFGPAAAEVGYTFSMSGMMNGFTPTEQRVVGVAVGKR